MFARSWISVLLVLAVFLSGCGGQKDVQELKEKVDPNYKMQMVEDDDASGAPNTEAKP